MSPCPCCQIEATDSQEPSSPTPITTSGGRSSGRGWFRRGLKVVQWLAPAVILALVPKCPACVAAYVALLTGAGISFSTAAYLRIILLALCLGSLAYLVARSMRHALLRRGVITG